MDADFSGYATKSGLKCSDGRTIMPGAFAHQDNVKVPLVWHHGHSNPENVLGHALLEARDDGMYCYGFFNGTAKAKHAAAVLEHGDVSAQVVRERPPVRGDPRERRMVEHRTRKRFGERCRRERR